MRQARDDDAFVGFHAIPDPERKAPHWCATMLARAANDLILERVLTRSFAIANHNPQIRELRAPQIVFRARTQSP